MRELAFRITKSHAFEYFIIGLIVFNGVLLGLETFPNISGPYKPWMDLAQDMILGVFIIEAGLKMFALSPQVHRYFTNGWNVFDFTIILASLIPIHRRVRGGGPTGPVDAHPAPDFRRPRTAADRGDPGASPSPVC